MIDCAVNEDSARGRGGRWWMVAKVVGEAGDRWRESEATVWDLSYVSHLHAKAPTRSGPTLAGTTMMLSLERGEVGWPK